ncbi:DUF2953 domain-containing protein [Paenibacillus radicis (ex Gao et al. 2016)]|uniref:DUF2953 domain-containing protein n=1 Tax=Paenibacillus radicis (ex Gao et al. 2016) TaxID=1737354 RepID=A0A917LU88_9BACL|nr:DUF2953 domain-containing protein [Paenibacillus radicis (ex Gao et al. 2016)]GGG57288.1 hypothetical protein GCM10010918_07920 [Paenibacillus radicis (ex Gao et al. 2016)]
MYGSLYGWIAAAVLFLLLLMTIVYVSPIVIHGHIRKTGSNDDIELDVKGLFGLVSYQMHIPTVEFYGRVFKLHQEMTGSGAGMTSKQEQDNEVGFERVMKVIDTFKQIIQLTNHLPSWVKQTLSKVQLKQWNWSTEVGVGDAMWTAMATGGIWSFKTTMIGVMSQLIRLTAEPQLQVQPNYSKASFSTEWSCMAQIRFGHAIVAGMHLFRNAKKSKGGMKEWQNILSKA